MAECRVGGGAGDCLIKLFGKTIPVPEAAAAVGEADKVGLVSLNIFALGRSVFRMDRVGVVVYLCLLGHSDLGYQNSVLNFGCGIILVYRVWNW